jgi:hypothetical protein
MLQSRSLFIFYSYTQIIVDDNFSGFQEVLLPLKYTMLLNVFQLSATMNICAGNV